MNLAIAVIGLAALTAALGALVTWLVARRTTSGRIETSDAKTLWEASEQMRQELRDEVVELRAQAVVLLAKIEALERRLAAYEPRHG